MLWFPSRNLMAYYGDQDRSPLYHRSQLLKKEPTVYSHYVEDVVETPITDRKCYKPFALQAGFLCSLLLLILVYIGLLEVAAHHYPRYDPSLIPTNVTRSPIRTTFLRTTGTAAARVTARQLGTAALARLVTSTANVDDPLAESPISAPVITSTAAASDFLQDDPDVTPDTGSGSMSASAADTADAGDFLDSDPTASVTPIASADEFLDPNPAIVTVPGVTPSVTPPAGATTTLSQPIAPTAEPGDFLDPGQTPYSGWSASGVATSSPPSATADPGAFLAGGDDPNQTAVSSAAGAGQNSADVGVDSGDSDSDDDSHGGAISPEDPDDERENHDHFFMGSLISVSELPDRTSQISALDYFIGSYMMVFLAIFLRILWTIVYNNIRMMEPFYQLSTGRGALGKDVLQALYLSNALTPELIRSSRAKHWIVVLASSIGLILDLFVSISSETLMVDAKHCHTRIKFKSDHQFCWPRVVIVGWTYHVAQGLLAVLFLSLLAMTCLNWKRRSGVYSDPSSLACMTSLLHHPEVVEQFQLLDPDVSSSNIEEDLGKDRYRLGHYHAANGALRYGIIPANGNFTPNTETESVFGKDSESFFDDRSSLHKPRRRSPHRKSKVKERALRFGADFGLLVFLLGVLGVIVAYYNESGDTPFNVFMNSNQFGPQFFFTMIGTIIVGLWRRTERETRTQAPYRKMTNPATAKPLLMVSQTSPWSTFPAALSVGSFFTSFVALNAMLAELLTIVLSGVPYNSGSFRIVNMICLWVSMGVLSFMCLSTASVLWRRKTGPKFPRPPETLANVWSYVAASHMRADFEELSTMSRDELKSRVLGWGKSYQFKQQSGVDGAYRFLVDEHVD